MTRALLKFSVVALGALALSCASIPLGNRTECEKLGAMPSDAEEYALGGSIALNWVQRNGGLISQKDGDNEKLVRYLNVVGKNLGAQSSRPELKWTFGVLQNEKSFNALSAPGGYIFVTLGLLRGVDNEAQLAGVLAHEIAHVTKRHVLTRYSETKVEVCQTGTIVSSGLKLVGNSVESSVDLPIADELLNFAKAGEALDLDKNPKLLNGLTDKVVKVLDAIGVGDDEEFAADEEAAHLLLSAGYDPDEYRKVLAKLPERNNSFANHPKKAERVTRLEAFLKQEQKPDEFPEYAAGTEELAKPPLPPEASLSKGSVAHDKP